MTDEDVRVSGEYNLQQRERKREQIGVLNTKVPKDKLINPSKKYMYYDPYDESYFGNQINSRDNNEIQEGE